MTELLPPISPGQILQEEFLEPLNMSMNQLATSLDVPANRISAIIHGSRSVTADTAMRLSRFFGNTPRFWLNLQSLYDLEVAEAAFSGEIEKQVTPLKEAE